MKEKDKGRNMLLSFCTFECHWETENVISCKLALSSDQQFKTRYGAGVGVENSNYSGFH